ncbi:hypothetical protein BLNAU_21421 [Blattamonas nauphoetae]|uniref:Uncharacterized protein n=1 Tax=Blattamonas nauphoetae TaxID=2049346 RepID=A0ABQ9WW04_9EUKA|nr:hypothetical protein BLNAU_21421 [Blattamonas nauphoetae]
MTSLPSTQTSGGPSGLSQKIIRCGIWSDTDHLSGPTCNDRNLGGFFLASNTSFVLCSITHKSKLFSTQTTITASTTFDTCTFKQCRSYPGCGGTLFMNDSSGAVTITQCSFHLCSSSVQAGAVYCESAGNTTPVVLKDSSFVECDSTTAGSVELPSPPFYSTTEHSTSQAMAVQGGSIEVLNGEGSLSFSFADTTEKDWDTNATLDQIITDWNGSDRTSAISLPANGARVLSLTTTKNGNSAELSLTLNTSATGTFLALLHNTFGPTRTDPALRPNTFRLVAFTFSGSESSTISFTTGNNYPLQSPLHEYMLHTVSSLGWVVDFPFIDTIRVYREEDGVFNRFPLKGYDVPNDKYAIILSNGKRLVVDVNNHGQVEPE